MIDIAKATLLRYPGGKQRQLINFLSLLPSHDRICHRYIEPFVGGASVFFAVNPDKAILSDANNELIDLYAAIKQNWSGVWRSYAAFPSTKSAYYKARALDPQKLTLNQRAARLLYLNRTCFKGMWRHNQSGQFNVGYGGQDRRWAISADNLRLVSKRLQNVTLKVADFEETLNQADEGDFVFLDPPYKPCAKELTNGHYVGARFTFEDHQRLAKSLALATKRRVKWALTTSSHEEVRSLFNDQLHHVLPKCTGNRPGILGDSGEVFIFNYGYHERLF